MASHSAHSFHIMMIDDDPDDLLLFTYAMESLPSPFQLSLKNNASKITEVLQKQTPDIIFLDLNMPVTNGAECLKEIRSHREFDEIPVVIYSTSNHKNDIHECFKNGANSYVVKPVTINAITKMIEVVCNDNWINAHLTYPQEDFILKFE